jgi:hypothetical protein
VDEQNGNIVDAAFNTGMLFFRDSDNAIDFVKLWIETIIQAGQNIHKTHVWDDQQVRQGTTRPKGF